MGGLPHRPEDRIQQHICDIAEAGLLGCHELHPCVVSLWRPQATEEIRLKHILVVGGGYAGFYTAWRLEKKLRPGRPGHVVDPRPYMTYQPFLPEVAAGSIEARHAAVSLRPHLQRTRLIAGARHR